MPGPNHNYYKYNYFSGQSPWRKTEKRSYQTRDRFSASESEEHRICVTGHDRQRRYAHPNQIVPGEASGDPYGQPALENIEQERNDSGRPPASTQDVGGSDVAAALCPDILACFPADQEIAERDRAK